MSPRNLATVLAPTILYTKDADVSSMVTFSHFFLNFSHYFLNFFLTFFSSFFQLEDMERANAVIAFLITEFDSIFPEESQRRTNAPAGEAPPVEGISLQTNSKNSSQNKKRKEKEEKEGWKFFGKKIH